MLDIRDPVSRVSLDTFYQVSFSFGNEDKWFKQSVSSGSKRAAGTTFKQKMSLLCTQAEIPGTSYLTTQAVGHHQGVQEVFPTLRQFPPLNLTFYVDADHLILEILESWMTYINPLSQNKRENAYGRLNYPETYKERLHVSKFERDTFLRGNDFGGNPRATTKLSHYEFVNVWPQNLQSMRISYGQSSILRCTIQLAYDRFFTSFQQSDERQQAIDRGDIINRSKDIKNTTPASDAAVEGGYTISRENLTTSQNVRLDNLQYGNTFPAGSF